jgi:hypothetical protein
MVGARLETLHADKFAIVVAGARMTGQRHNLQRHSNGKGPNRATQCGRFDKS